MTSDEHIGSIKITLQLVGNMFRNCEQSNPLVTVNAPLQSAKQPVIKPSMNQNGPLQGRIPQQSQLLTNFFIVRMKDNVDGNGFGVRRIDARRIQQISRLRDSFSIEAASNPIRKIPPEELEQVRPRNRMYLVPADRCFARYGRRAFHG